MSVKPGTQSVALRELMDGGLRSFGDAVLILLLTPGRVNLCLCVVPEPPHSRQGMFWDQGPTFNLVSVSKRTIWHQGTKVSLQWEFRPLRSQGTWGLILKHKGEKQDIKKKKKLFRNGKRYKEPLTVLHL